MNLLLLTKFYPYGKGEAFIENEINILSKRFEKIIIIACEVPKQEKLKRKIPSNVIAYKINQERKKKVVIDGVIKYNFNKNKEMKKELNQVDKMIQKFFLLYFEEKSQMIAKKIEKNSFIKDFLSTPYILYSYWLFTTARVGILLSKKYPPKYRICRAHGYDLYEELNKIHYLPYRNLFLDYYDKIYPCSDNGTEFLRNRYPKYKEKIQTNYLGTLDYGICSNKDDGVFRIISCSRVSPEKRIERIIDALAYFEEGNIKVEWTHVGGGKDLKKLIEHAHKKLKKVKSIFKGNVSNQEVIQLYKNNQYDVFINVSEREGLPVSIMEAISFGTPIIATDVGGTNEIVKENINGFFLKKNFKNKDLYDAIKKIIRYSNSQYLYLRKNAREIWEEKFMATKNYEKFVEAITNKGEK